MEDTSPLINNIPIVENAAQEVDKLAEKLGFEKNYEVEIVTEEALRSEILTEEERTALDKFKEENTELCEGKDDVFLMLFIWARKMELDRAAELLKNHLELRKKFDLENINYQWIYEMLYQEISFGTQIAGVDSFDAKKRMLSFILPINMIKLVNPQQDKLFINKMAHYGWWTIQKIFYQKKYISCFRDGVVYLEDFKDVSVFKMTSTLDRNTMKEMMETMQDGFPLRIRMIYLYNFPVWLRVLIAIVKPFMKKKLRNKIQVITSQEELFRIIPQQYLIPFFGGTLDFDMKDYLKNSAEFKEIYAKEHN